MTILCGTDFSDHARHAAEVGAAMARRLQVPLVLVHVIDELGAELAVESHEDALYRPLRQRLADEAKSLAERFGIVVEPLAPAGIAHRTLVELAQERKARLIVVSSLSRDQHWWSLGSVAERAAQMSPVPVLVVRDAERLVPWATGERPLRVMVGVESGAASRAALDFAMQLRELNDCHLIVTQIAWPASEYYRFGIAAPVPVDHLRPELEKLLVRDLESWCGELMGRGDLEFLVRPGLGRVDTHLALIAAEQDVDLVVVGTHQRSGVARLWQASVSRGVLHSATTNVLTVPAASANNQSTEIRSFRRVVVATDLSELSMRAIGVGYGMAGPDGLVHLVYVRTPDDKADSQSLTTKLRTLIPPGAAARGIATEIEVVSDEVAHLGICRAASRVGADAICMATHGRGGATRLLLGSQAQEVLQRAGRPVVLVPPCEAD